MYIQNLAGLTDKSIAQFFSHISYPDGPDGCWTWAPSGDASLTERRRGIMVRYQDRGFRYVRPAKIAYELYFALIPSHRRNLRMSCGHTDCVNPTHVTFTPIRVAPPRLSEEALRAVKLRSLERGRAHRTVLCGEEAPNSRLTWDQVRQMRHLYTHDGASVVRMAETYRVSVANVYSILKGRTWKERQKEAELV